MAKSHTSDRASGVSTLKARIIRAINLIQSHWTIT